MPFPLAHPAAVLPLRRFCPRWLSFPALVVGSLIPDAGYLFGEQHGGARSHELLGSLEFCLPVGLVTVMLFYWLRAPLVRLTPEGYRRSLLPFCERPLGPAWGLLLSLLIGTWTHQLWDSFTHTDGWAVQQLPLLRMVVFKAAGRTARVCHILWYGFSLVGVIWVFLAFEKWKRASVTGAVAVSGRAVLLDAALVALLVLPIALAHHLVRHNHLGLLIVGGFCTLPILGIFLRLGNRRDRPRNPDVGETPQH